MPIKKLNQTNATIIRVWKSALAGGEGVGHVSLEIPSIDLYISLWPESPPLTTREPGLFKAGTHRFYNLKEDELVEKRPPETTVALYSLNISAIEAKYVQEKEKLDKSGWQLIRGTLFPIDAGHSCASIAYALLNAGNIYDLISGAYSSSFSSASRPEEIAMIAQAAKKQELKEYPETKEFFLSREMKKEEQLTKCAVM